MTGQQFKRWMSSKSRQYIWLILRTDPNRVKISFINTFTHSFKHSHGRCNKSDQHITYRTDYVINGWDCDLNVLEKLVIHEVCHLKYRQHDNSFFELYKKWSDDDFIERWHNGNILYNVGDEKFTCHIVGLPKL